MTIDADQVHYRELNERVRSALRDGLKEVTIDNVRGQRYIGAGLNRAVRITINGVPGNDLGAFMDGPEIVVNGNGQDGVGNTMNSGKIVIHGDAGDVLGYSMRGGRIFVRGSVGYRTGIHMKSYRDRVPVVVIGGAAKDYFGEYMAGGVLVVLGLAGSGQSVIGEYCGTGMHGGVIYVRGEVQRHQIGDEVGISGELSDSDWTELRSVLEEYCCDFNLSIEDFQRKDFIKLTPQTIRPYGSLYAY